MPNRKYHKIRVVFTVILAVLLLIWGFVLKAPFIGISAPETSHDFSSIIKDNVSGSTKLTDIAMLGAHDAFAHKISGSSKYDSNAESAYNNRALFFLMSGILARNTKTQVSSAYKLLTHGVRYFDVRITLHNGEWYAHHNLISDKLSAYLKDTIRFLNENNGEFIVFDIQHARLADREYRELLDYISSVKEGGNSLSDYVNFDPRYTLLSDLTLDDATLNGTKAGAVVLAKADFYYGSFHYEYFSSIRSEWHSEFATKNILPKINAEYKTLKDNEDLDRNKFRVNQAQLTPNYGKGFFQCVTDWTLLNRAQKHNQELLNHKDFNAWLSVMPIFMCDFSDSQKGNFNKLVIEKINQFNALNSK
ncbi:MAG: hypothetical protein FWD49_03745 [Firmicutes bacterium]|nr:hypothetical protein [Bacillota bacterium]